MMNNPRKRSYDDCSSVSETSKYQKQFEDLPSEIILKILKNLGIKDLLRCGMVSKQIRTITRDKSLWEKISLFGMHGDVPVEFLQVVLDSGCKYLCLASAKIVCKKSFFKKLKKPSKLRCLDLGFCRSNTKIIEEILASCKSLEKLNLIGQSMTHKMIKNIIMQG